MAEANDSYGSVNIPSDILNMMESEGGFFPDISLGDSLLTATSPGK